MQDFHVNLHVIRAPVQIRAKSLISAAVLKTRKNTVNDIRPRGLNPPPD